jgi:hypothetical protein
MKNLFLVPVTVYLVSLFAGPFCFAAGRSTFKPQAIKVASPKSHGPFEGIYVAPTFGVMNFEKGTGAGASPVTIGGEVTIFTQDLWVTGFKLDHTDLGKEGEGTVKVQTSATLLMLRGGRKLVEGNFGPYLAAGAGTYSSHVTTHIANLGYDDYDTRFAFNLAIGTVGKVLDDWALGAAIYYFPQSFINSLNFVFSAGYYF